MTTRVVILTAAYGTGHVIVAKALDEAFRKKGVKPVVIDLVEIGGKTEKAAASFYNFLMKRGHFVWKLYHDFIMPIRKGESIRTVFKKIHRQKFFKDIEKINPDLIISTMDQASIIASLYKSKHPDVKIATVVTDYVVHPLWVWENMDYYFVGSEEIQNYLEKHEIEGKKIYRTGIPLRTQFQNIPSKKEARKSLGIPDDGRIVILLSVGSFGSVPISIVLKTLEERSDIFIMILAGKEEQVPEYADLLRINGLIGKVVGYTDQVEMFMASSDLFISKAGGVTVAECLAAGLPSIYVHNFPGHETGNARYTEKHGASKIAKNKTDLEKIISKLIENKYILQEMSKEAKKLSSPHASDVVVDTLL